jgi:hypothetical protein
MSSAPERSEWHGALMKWLTSAIYASVKTMGPRQAKVMSRAMSLVFVRLTANEVAAKKGIQMSPSDDPVKLCEQYRAVEGASGLASPDDVSFESKPDGELAITFVKCPYGPLCNETLAGLLSRGDFNKSSVPCMRMDTYSAALGVAGNIKRPYRLVQFAPGARCQGALLAARSAR